MSAFSDFMANLGRIVENPTLGDLPAMGGILRGASPTTAQAPIFPHKAQVDALPLVGGAMNLGSKALVGVPLAAMEAQIQGAHKVNQISDESAGGLTALLMGVAKGGRLKTALRDPNYVMTPDDINTAKAMAALEQGHLMRAQEIFQSGPDSTSAYVAGAGRLVLNPLNFIGAVGAALRVPRAIGLAAEAARGAGVAGEAARGIGLAGNVARGAWALGDALVATDRFMALPFTAAGGALRQLPSGVARTLGGATAGAIGGAGYSKLTGDDQGLRDAMIGAAGMSAFAKYLARNAPELAPTVAQDMTPAITAAGRAAPDLPPAIPSYEPLPRPARLPEAPNFPRPTGEPLAPPEPLPVTPTAPLGDGGAARREQAFARYLEKSAFAKYLAPDAPELAPAVVGTERALPLPMTTAPALRPEPPAGTPALPEPVTAMPAVPANALSIGERGALLDRVTSGEFGPIGQVLGALHQANYGANAAFALKSIFGKATVPADAVRNHVDYMLARTLDDPQRWDALAQRAPQLAQALDTVPLAQVPTDTMQQVLRATLGRPLKGKLPKGAALPTTERPVDEVAADILRATQQGDQAALGGYLNEYRALKQPKPEIATPPAAAEIPSPVEPTLYRRAVALLQSDKFPPYIQAVPPPPSLAKNLGIPVEDAVLLRQHLINDPRVTTIAADGRPLLRSRLPAADLPSPMTPAPVASRAAEPPSAAASVPPPAAADPLAAYRGDLPPVTTAPVAGDTLYQRAVGLLHGGDPQFNSPYVPGPTYFTRRLPIDEATANAIVQRLVQDPAIVEIAPTGEAMLRSQMNPKYRATPAAEAAPATSALDTMYQQIVDTLRSGQTGQERDTTRRLRLIANDLGLSPDRVARLWDRALKDPSRFPAPVAAQPPTLTPVQQAAQGTAAQIPGDLYQRAVAWLKSDAPWLNSGALPTALRLQKALGVAYDDARQILTTIKEDPSVVVTGADGSLRLRRDAPRVSDAGNVAAGDPVLDAMVSVKAPPVRLRAAPFGLPEPTRGVITRLFRHSGGQKPASPVDVVADIYDNLAIHKDVRPGRVRQGADYIVTHIPSGLQIATTSTKRQAQAAVATLRNTGIDWSQKELPQLSDAQTAALAETLSSGRTAPNTTDLNSLLPPGLTDSWKGRAAAGALAGGLSAYGDPNATPQDVLLRGLVGAGVSASAPMALRGATRLARQLVPDAPKAWQELTANVLHDVTRIKEFPERVAELGQEVALSAQYAWQKGKAEFGGADVPFYKAPAAAMKQWRAQIVATLHNLLQDDLTTRGKYILFGKQDGVALSDFVQTRASLRRNFHNADALSKHSDGVQELLTSTGNQDYAVGQELGAGVIDESTQGGNYAGPLQRAVVGAGISLANPITGLVPMASVAYGAARGVMEPFVNNFFHALNGFVHLAGREGYFVPVATRELDRAATPFLGNLARQGVDTTALAARAGQFSANEVEQAALAAGVLPDAAATLGAQWAEASKGALDKAAARVRTVFGDMNALGGLGRNLSGMTPFASWPISQAKITAELLAKYPGPTAVLAGAMRRNEADLKRRGEPGYYAASLPIPTDLPVLGGLARARLGGEQGTVYLSPASLLVPGTDPLTVSTPTTKDQQKTAYQRAQDLLGLAGLSWGPAVQAGAYATGQDYRRPGPLSRAAGLEAAVPGPAIGAWPVQALDATRKLLVPPLAKAGVPTGSASTPPDPIQKELAALVWQRKGKVLGDAGTEQELRDSMDPRSALYQEALQRVKNRAALGNAVSVTSPFTISANPAMTSELYQARAQTPYDYTALKTMETFAKRAPDARFTPEERQALLTTAMPIVNMPADGTRLESLPPQLLAAEALQAMQYRNYIYATTHPASRVMGMAATKPRTDALLRQWDNDHFMLQLISPPDFKRRRAEYKQSLAAP